MKPKLLILIVAYFAERTIEQVLSRISKSLNDVCTTEILILDDGSTDETFPASVRAERAGIPFKLHILHNPHNQGYGGNQKIGYHFAIENGFDIVALLHGDGQYAPERLPYLIEPLIGDKADAVFGSRMMESGQALKGGMPLYKYVGNRILTSIQNRLLGTDFSEFHSGYRVYSVRALASIPFERNSNAFPFDTEIIIQLTMAGKRIKELPIPTYYGDEICRVNGMKYAFDVLKASAQARLQLVSLFYDRKFDCVAQDRGRQYPSKLGFESTHTRVLDLVPRGARIIDLGAGLGAVGAALKQRKQCRVFGCDTVKGPAVEAYDRFVIADLNDGLPDFGDEPVDYILALDVIEHLKSPEEFLDALRALAAKKRAQIILTTANVAFVLMRLSLLLGRFEYGKRGILDLTHTRLFTMHTLRRALITAGLESRRMEGVVVPIPLVFGDTRLSRVLSAINRALVKVWPSLFGFQLLVVASARPTLATLLEAAEDSSKKKLAAMTVEEVD